MRLDLRPVFILGFAALAGTPYGARAGFYDQVNLVSDLSTVGARTVDPNLQNPWGVSNAPGGPFWVSNAGSNTSTLYDAHGNKVPLTVSVPGGPTGQVFNGSKSDFLLPTSNGSTTSASFIFDTLKGGIYAWSGATGTLSEASNANAGYTGLALGNSSLAGGNVLYAADNNSTHIDVYDNKFSSLTGATGAFNGKFVDSQLPAGFNAFNVVNLNGMLYVTYNSTTGGGVIDEYSYNGDLIKRLATDLTGNQLAGPWGLAMAPVGFGRFGGDLLVGNNDTGTISALDPNTGAFLGFLTDASGNPIVNDGLWSLEFGNTVRNGDPNSLYIFAGINGEHDGLIAQITSVPEPNSAILAAIGGLSAVVVARRRRAARRA